jgi:hypothetical protein
MIKINSLLVGLICLLLTACTNNPDKPPVVFTPPAISEALTTCAPRPAHPCPPPPEPKDKKPAGPVLIADSGLPMVEVLPERVCTSDDLRRWEALLFFAHADCASKLARVRTLLAKPRGLSQAPP